MTLTYPGTWWCCCYVHGHSSHQKLCHSKLRPLLCSNLPATQRAWRLWVWYQRSNRCELQARMDLLQVLAEITNCSTVYVAFLLFTLPAWWFQAGMLFESDGALLWSKSWTTSDFCSSTCDIQGTIRAAFRGACKEPMKLYAIRLEEETERRVSIYIIREHFVTLMVTNSRIWFLFVHQEPGRSHRA